MDFVPKNLDIVFKIDGERVGDCRFQARQYKNDDNEVKIDVFYEEDIERGAKMAFSEEADEIADYLRKQGKDKIEKKVVCFINRKTKTLEIYRGKDHITEKIKQAIQRLLGVNMDQVNLNSQKLLSIANVNSEEIKQAMFKYIHGMWYQILRGNRLENNQKYLEYLSYKPESLRMISVIPRINWANGSKYMVTFNGDRGTISMTSGAFRFKPREEVRQFVNLMVGMVN
jgi:hypothetical protein